MRSAGTSQAGVATGVRRASGGGHRRAHAPRVPFALLVVGLIVGGMCALLALNTASAANELARHDLAGKDSDVSARLEQVRNAVAASAAPGSLGSAAAALGMVPAGAPAFLKIGADGKVTLLGSPAPATSPPLPVPPAVPKPTPAGPKKTPATTTSKATATARTHTTARTTLKPPTTTPTTAPTTTPTPITTLPGGTR